MQNAEAVARIYASSGTNNMLNLNVALADVPRPIVERAPGCKPRGGAAMMTGLAAGVGGPVETKVAALGSGRTAVSAPKLNGAPIPGHGGEADPSPFSAEKETDRVEGEPSTVVARRTHAVEEVAFIEEAEILAEEAIAVDTIDNFGKATEAKNLKMALYRQRNYKTCLI